jgi:soluble lytic murein transglycosylase-like protein
LTLLRRASVLGACVVVVAALAAALSSAAPDLATAIPQAPAEPAAPGPAPLAARFRAEAEWLRAGDCAAARRSLKERASSAPQGAEAAAARFLGGFASHVCGDFAAAVEPLHQSAAIAREDSAWAGFEDWRLLLLALDARSSGQTVLSLAAFERLLADHRTSPLWPTAVLEAARAARDLGHFDRALEWTARGLDAQPTADGASLPVDTRRELERLRWEIAAARGDQAARRTAARRLLRDFPFEAAEVRAVDVLRQPSGAVDWMAELGSAGLETRGANLLDLGVAAGALDALEAIPDERRGAVWRLLRARGLVLDHQAREALRMLDEAPPVGSGAAPPAGEVAWVRALACGELLRVGSASARHPERPAIADAERAFFVQARREALAAAAADPSTGLELRQGALRLLFADFAQAEMDEEAARTLLDLRILAPDDLSGARYLWERGWKALRQSDEPAAAVAAIERWHLLISTYPESRFARSAQYWTARARETLGQEGAAVASYRALAAADTNDFYRRHAVARLGWLPASVTETPQLDPDLTAPGSPARAAWPAPRELERARLLSDLGLDALATVELDGIEAAATPIDRRALLATRGLLAARRGERRTSLRLLGEAFPALAGAHQSDLPEEALRLYYPIDFEATIRAMARAEGLPPAVIFGMIHQESGFDAKAVSASGARGLMQLMPATAKELSRRLKLRYSIAGLERPEISVRLGTAYFRQVLGMFDGNLELALVGYNSGPFRIRRLWHGEEQELDSFVEDLAPDEPKIYVKRILALADTYRRLYPQLG